MSCYGNKAPDIFHILLIVFCVPKDYTALWAIRSGIGINNGVGTVTPLPRNTMLIKPVRNYNNSKMNCSQSWKEEFILYTQLAFNISNLSSDFYENIAHIARYWNNIKLAREAFLSQCSFRTERSTLKCNKIKLHLVSSLFSRYRVIFI